MTPFEKSNFIKKLLYQSKNRGYKENDLILGKFAEKFLNEMDLETMYNFKAILQENDGDIYNWLTHKDLPPKRLSSKIMTELLKFNFNN